MGSSWEGMRWDGGWSHSWLCFSAFPFHMPDHLNTSWPGSKGKSGMEPGKKPPRTLSYTKQDPVWGSSVNIKIKAT